MAVKLTTEQQQAIAYTASPLLITGPTGTGKSIVLAYKVAHLIQEVGINPRKILVSTLNQRTTNYLKQLISKITNTPHVNVISFRDLTIEILQQHIHKLGWNHNFTIISEAEQRYIITQILNADDISENSSDCFQKIQQFKQQLMNPHDLSKNEKIATDTLRHIYSRYQSYLKNNNILDEDDLPLLCAEILKNQEEAQHILGTNYQSVIIDNYEDVNVAQRRLCQLIQAQVSYFCAAGDSHQNISKHLNNNELPILQFKKDYQDAKTLNLSRYYRNSKSIMEAMKHLFKKRPIYCNTHNTSGQALLHYTAWDNKDELDFITEKINTLIKENNYSWKDITICARTQEQCNTIAEQLNKVDIPSRVLGKDSFFDKYGIRDLINYLRLVLNPCDNQAFLRVGRLHKLTRANLKEFLQCSIKHNKPIYKLTKSDLNHAQYCFDKVTQLFKITNDLQNWYNKQPNTTIAALIKRILDKTHYKKMLIKDNTLASWQEIESIYKFINMVDNNNRSLGHFLSTIINPIVQEELIKKNNPDLQNSITVCTLNHMKGLYTKVLFIVGIEEGLIPHYEAQIDPKLLDIEKRLLYMSMTRTQQMVYLTSARERQLFNETWFNSLSRFLKEIPHQHISYLVCERVETVDKRIMRFLDDINATVHIRKLQHKPISNEHTDDYTVGDIVQHPTLGKGVVQKVSGQKERTVLSIQFPEGMKKVMLKYATIKKHGF